MVHVSTKGSPDVTSGALAVSVTATSGRRFTLTLTAAGNDAPQTRLKYSVVALFVRTLTVPLAGWLPYQFPIPAAPVATHAEPSADDHVSVTVSKRVTSV